MLSQQQQRKETNQFYSTHTWHTFSQNVANSNNSSVRLWFSFHFDRDRKGEKQWKYFSLNVFWCTQFYHRYIVSMSIKAANDSRKTNKKIEKQTKKKNRLRFSSLCKVSFAAIVYIYYFISYSSTCGIVSSTDKSHIRLKKHCSTSNGPCNIGIDILFQFVFWRIIGPKSSMCDLHRFWWPLQHRI